MEQTKIANILLAATTVVLAGAVGYFMFIKGPAPDDGAVTESAAYSTEPIAECLACEGLGLNAENCCTADFEKDCISQNGVIRYTDMHPSSTMIMSCFQKAPDAGKGCASGTDCMSGVCDLENAVASNKCALIEKELSGEKNPYGGQAFYTATYSCPTVEPGVCTEAEENGMNPGGIRRTFEMDDRTLIETVEPGPIY